MRWMLALLVVLLPLTANAQKNQCRTSPVGASTAYCASEAFVTETAAAVPQGTVTEQKNTFGYGLTTSGNCDNTSNNAGSPCNAAVTLTTATNSLGADVNLTVSGAYGNGPSMAQGTVGTWTAYGGVTLADNSGAGSFKCKLWDGTTVIDSRSGASLGAGITTTIFLAGNIASPAGNLRIDCADNNGSPNGKILFNSSGNSKDSTVSGHRIQ